MATFTIDSDPTTAPAPERRPAKAKAARKSVKSVKTAKKTSRPKTGREELQGAPAFRVSRR
jgi:hypothetical protein